MKSKFLNKLILICLIALAAPVASYAASDSSGSLHYVGDGSKPVAGATLITFGSYPQTEILADESQSGAFGKEWADPQKDWEINQDLYEALQSDETIYDENGDTVIGGSKYKRISEENALASIDTDSYYTWADPDQYHYFRYEPIKWQVLTNSQTEALLLSCQVLDDCQYKSSYASTTWETSSLRSWLNGEQTGDFMAAAFSQEEQAAIIPVTLTNKDNEDMKVPGGNDTRDKIFLLATDDLSGKNISNYGFAKDITLSFDDKLASSTTYAKSRGVWSNTSEEVLGNCAWWLRSPGHYSDTAAAVKSDGSINQECEVDNRYTGVRPALKLDLTKTEVFGSAADLSKLKDISEFHLAEDTYNYNGKERKPAVSIDGLKEGEDFTVAYSSNLKPGQATVTVRGIGDWQGTLTGHFNIIYDVVETGSLKRVLQNDCIYYGTYPKREIVYSAQYAVTAGQEWDDQGKFYIVDKALYNKLMAAEWTSKDNTIIGESKYKRVKCRDKQYHYFKYEKIKWRILTRSDKSMLVLSDECLDCMPYNVEDVKTSWENCDLYKWLNSDFISTAFTASQQKALKTSSAGKGKAFCLGLENVYKEKALDYGFDPESMTGGSVKYPERMAGFSAYAYSKNYYNPVCSWWLRDYVDWVWDATAATLINEYGQVYDWDYTSVADVRIGVRPALLLSLEDGRTYTSAGKTEIFKTLTIADMITCFDVYPLTGSETCPKVTISGLKEGRDFNVSYVNNSEMGVGTIIASGTGKYTGAIKRSFLIFDKVDLSGLKMKLSADEFIYRGSACKPKVTINGLTEGVDFKVTYSSNNSIGIAKAKATGINGWEGSISRDFKIKKGIDISKKTAKLSATSLTYTGKARKPAVTISGLTSGQDYTVTYSNNIKAGKAKAKITGTGEYVGSITKSFKILPKGTSIVSFSRYAKAFGVKWNRQSVQTTGYQLRYSRYSNMASAKAVKITSNRTISKKVTGLSAKRKYYVQIRTYKTAGGVNYYSGWSKIKYVTTK